ncbi:MAG: hypothetical protein R3B69_01190 [Candidatus Paceibacterota bacterium]
MKNLCTSAWQHSLGTALLLAFVGACYHYVQADSLNVYAVNRIIADVALLLIGYSIAVGALVKWWGIGTTTIAYRREYGVLGFALALLHGVLTFALPRFSLTGLLLPENIVGFGAAVISLTLLTIMTAVSVAWIKNTIGMLWWRRTLSIGIYAYGFGLLHAVIKSVDVWSYASWHQAGLPPLSLFVCGAASAMFFVWWFARFVR